ncbi:MAG: F0F1 ATP synthase subunit B [Parcubacteria group bacterium]|nr:F0F1 ATP synthase subunit B [Parcubacteria group bacterium]
MNPIVESFHIDAGLLIAQVINFAIVLAVLYFFVVKPLTNVLEERANKVEKGIADAKEADMHLKKAQSEYEEKLTEAKKEAHALLEKTKEDAEKSRVAALAEIKEEMQREADKERARMKEERAQLKHELREETADLVVLSLEKVLGTLDSETHKNLVKEIYNESSK